jgi:nickel-dependent lactate racemase
VKIELTTFETSVEVRDDALVQLQRSVSPRSPIDPVEAIRSALNNPIGFPALNRALTPDDRIVVVVDDRLPEPKVLVGELLHYLGEVGIVPECITLLSAAGSRQQWVDDLPDVWQDVRTEIHDPTDRKRLSYLATTRQGRRLYLNRTLIDADQVVVLTGCRFDVRLGYVGGAASLFPAFSNSETLQQLADVPATKKGGESPIESEAEEVAWLLGAPFFVQVVPGAVGSIMHVIGGTAATFAEAQKRCSDLWRFRIERMPHTIVVPLTAEPAIQDFPMIADAALNAARIVEPEGRIIILSQANPDLDDAWLLLRDTDNPAVAARRVQERQPAGGRVAQTWLEAAQRANLYLLSRLPDDVVEELFATPLQDARQVQRLVDAAPSCLVLPDAHMALTVLE